MNAMDNLLEMMAVFGLPVLKQGEKQVETLSGFLIEVERVGLYKLIHLGDVIAPFDDLEEMCDFIKEHS
ncbi:MAG: hypothetical protein Q8M62_11065 [Algoriphagus sp.]|uniref:hypothetical protein n=1 Tax=Algoriphagus sp. TaxID=1872435 RepID=UPI002735530B|nr:hypothetical protein [Algoriphagus sp.]MDP3200361.1 hypothetical protein [Algoriphagus sp.]